MQDFVEFYGQDIRKKKQLKLPLRNAKCGYVDVRDTARVIKKVLTSNTAKNKTYTLTGPESLSCLEVAELFAEVMGKKINYVDIKLKEFKKDMMDAGVKEPVAEAYSELYKLVREGLYDQVTDNIYKLTERQPHTFEEFLDDNVKFFLGKELQSASSEQPGQFQLFIKLFFNSMYLLRILLCFHYFGIMIIQY